MKSQDVCITSWSKGCALLFSLPDFSGTRLGLLPEWHNTLISFCRKTKAPETGTYQRFFEESLLGSSVATRPMTSRKSGFWRPTSRE